MDSEISILTSNEIGAFYPVFCQIMKTAFACYTQKMINFFIDKVYTPANFFFWINNQYKTVLVIKIKKEFAGFAMIDQPYGGVSMCRWLGIQPKYQKKGFGSKLINAWIDLAKSQGCHKVELAAQTAAKKFYEKVGLTLEGERKLSYFGTNQYIFGKIIGPPNENTMTKYY